MGIKARLRPVRDVAYLEVDPITDLDDDTFPDGSSSHSGFWSSVTGRVSSYKPPRGRARRATSAPRSRPAAAAHWSSRRGRDVTSPGRMPLYRTLVGMPGYGLSAVATPCRSAHRRSNTSKRVADLVAHLPALLGRCGQRKPSVSAACGRKAAPRPHAAFKRRGCDQLSVFSGDRIAQA
jgi:hypothetical protein